MIITNKNNKYEKYILNFMLIYGLFSCYIEFFEIWNLLLVAAFIFLLIISKDFRRSLTNKPGLFILTMLFIFFLFINVLNSTNNEYIISNLTQLAKVLIIFMIICGIAYENNNVFKNFMLDKFKLINLMWILNIIILFIQEKGTGFLIKSKWLAINNFYPDHCSGLFGFSGTHILALFSIFVFIYNNFYITYKENKKNNRLIIIYNIITMVIMLILSTQNDNNAIFLLYFIFLCFYLIEKSQSQKKQLIKKVMNIIGYIAIVLFTLVLIYKIPLINEFINNTLFERMDKVFSDNKSANGSNERLAIFYYSLTDADGWKLGSGIGSWPFDQPNYMGFVHFGLSSIGTITMLGGIWTYIYMILYYSRILIGKNRWNRKKLIIYIINVFILTILSIFTTILTSGILVFWLTLIMTIINSIAFNFEEGEVNEKK